jgi:hypothetical protein
MSDRRWVAMSAGAVVIALVLPVSAAVGADPGSTPQLTFDGATCIYEGPEEMDAGEVEVTFDNQSGDFAALTVLELPEDEGTRDAEMSLIYADLPIPPEPDPDRVRLVGVVLAGPGETVTEAAPLPAGGYVLDCATIEGDTPSRAWRAVRPVPLRVGS